MDLLSLLSMPQNGVSVLGQESIIRKNTYYLLRSDHILKPTLRIRLCPDIHIHFERALGSFDKEISLTLYTIDHFDFPSLPAFSGLGTIIRFLTAVTGLAVVGSGSFSGFAWTRFRFYPNR